MYNSIAEHVFLPIFDLTRSTGISRCLKSLEKSQWYSSDRLQRIQNSDLAVLLEHAYENVPYYHKLFRTMRLRPGQIRNVEDLKNLPIITKQHVRNNLQNMKAVNVSPKETLLYVTGGSTGEPMGFWVSRADRSWGTAAMLRSNSWCSSYRLGDPMALVWASHVDLKESTKLKERMLNFFMRRELLNAYHLSEESMLSFTKRLVNSKPKVIRGYSSAVYLLACFVEREGAVIRPKGVITTAEMLLPHQRSKIEKVFGCKVYDSYGSREFEEIASECSEHSGYHIAAENLVLEFVKDGEHVSPGETGEILVTDLRSYAMPFIRYSIGDLGKPSNETCSCGRGLPLMKSVEGRLTDIIVAPNHSYLSVFDVPLCDMLQIKEYQIIQEEIDKIVVRIVKGPGYSEEDTQQIIDVMKQYLGKKVELSMEFVSSIPNAKSGKRRFVISKVKTPFGTTQVQNQN